MSPDVNKWVFAYVTPIILDDGSKPAIYHFEMPINYFQKRVKGHKEEMKISEDAHGEMDMEGHVGFSKVGTRTFVIDPSGLIVADSEMDIDINLKEGSDAEQQLKDYLPKVGMISKSEDFNNVVKDMNDGGKGTRIMNLDGEPYYISYHPLPTFGWSIAIMKSYDGLLTGKSSLVDLKKNIFTILFISLLITIVLTFFLANRITTPVNELRNICEEITDGKFDHEITHFKTKDEVTELAGSFEMIMAAFRMMREQVNDKMNEVSKKKGENK